MRDILVLGTGAMGMLFASRLATAGQRVTIAGTWQAGLDAIERGGIRVLEGDPQAPSSTVRVSEVTSYAAGAGRVSRGGARSGARISADNSHTGLPYVNGVGSAAVQSHGFDLALVLVKQHQTAGAVAVLADSLRPDGVALSLQNGLGAREILESVVGAWRTAIGVTTVGATLVGPGTVRLGGPGETIIGGPVARPRLEVVARILTDAGFTTEVTDDIDAAVWTKIAVNAAINGVTAVLRDVNGIVVEPGEPRRLALEAAREVAAVARALGVRLSGDVEAAVTRVATNTADNRSSMLQDLEAGRPTEVEAIHGEVARHGAALGIPTPTIKWLLDRIRAAETEARGVNSARIGSPPGRLERAS